jgi:hypothetical protein
MRLKIGENKSKNKDPFYLEIKKQENIFVTCPDYTGIYHHMISLFSALIEDNNIEASITIRQKKSASSASYFYNLLSLHNIKDKFELIDLTRIKYSDSACNITKVINHYLENKKHIIILLPEIQNNFDNFFINILDNLKINENSIPIFTENISNVIFNNINTFNDFTDYLNNKNYFFINLIDKFEKSFFSEANIKELSLMNQHIINLKQNKKEGINVNYLYKDKNMINEIFLFIHKSILLDDSSFKLEYKIVDIKKTLLSINISNF